MDYNKRIDDNFLKAEYVDGEVLQHTDMNELESVVKLGVNANYEDIQKIQDGTISVENSNKLSGATLSKVSSEALQNSDIKVPTSAQVKQYIDSAISSIDLTGYASEIFVENEIADTVEIYDSNGNGIVDNAEKVNNHTVDKDVPSDAKFTDTIYDDTEVRGLISDLDDAKVDKVTGKGLSTNDYTTTEKNKLAGIANNAQVNVLEKVSVNGTQQTISNKSVNIPVPTQLSQLSDDSTHRLVTDTEKTTWNSKYLKPSGGIPKSDLASAVQTSLGKADTALQEHQDISGKEDKSNKVTLISSSSTDIEYPSAKCMYDSQSSQDTEINYLNSVIEQLPRDEATGTSATLQPTIQAKMKMSLAPSELSQDATPTPDSPQDIHTISGDNSVLVRNKNLLNIQTIVKGRLDNGNVGYASGTTDLILNEDSVTFTTNTGWRGIVTDYIETKESSTYMFSSLFQIISQNTTISIACYDKDKNWLSNASTYAYGNYAIRFITKPNTKFIRLAIQLATATTITIEKPQIEEATALTEYIKHQEQTAQLNLGNIEYCKIGDYEDEFIRSDGKNIFTTDGYWSISANCEYTITGKNEFIFKVNNETAWQNIQFRFSNLKQNTDYTFSGIFKRLSGNTGYITINGLNTSTKLVEGNTSIPRTFNTGTNTGIQINIYATTNPGMLETMNCSEIMLNKGTTALPYEPYGTNQWYLKKNIGKVVLDGTEGWYLATTGVDYIEYGCTNIMINGKTGYNNCITNYFSNSSNNRCLSNGTSCLIRTPDTTITTNTAFKTWLSTHNTIVYYILATPTYTQITGTLETQLNNIYKNMLSYKGTTNVSQINNDLPFVISASAIKDINTMISELTNAIIELGGE